MILLYHAPFFVPYIKQLLVKGDDSAAQIQRYQYRTLTTRVYFYRVILWTMAGLAFIVYALNEREVIEHFCDSYTDIRYNLLAKL